MRNPRRASTDGLQRIPGVGPSMATDLRRVGVERLEDLAGRDPRQLYEQLEDLAGEHVDRCVLYVFRAAVYFASTADLEPELTKWWSWKDGGLAERRGLVAPPDTRPRRETA